MIAKKGSPATSLIYTNRTGKTYFRAGDIYTELMDSDYTVGANKKQAQMQFTVKIVSATSDSTSPSTNSLASVAGTYTIKAKASGSAKVGLTQTTTGGTDTSTPCVNFANPTAAASGVLGAEEDAEVEIMRIYISAQGAVTYRTNAVATVEPAVAAWGGDATSWANADLKDGVDSFNFYYGLEVKSGAAENATSGYELQDDTYVTALVSGVALDGTTPITIS